MGTLRLLGTKRMFTADQHRQYQEQGFLVLVTPLAKNGFTRRRSRPSSTSMMVGVKRNTKWPNAGRYTLIKSSWCDPDFSFAEHPRC